MDAFFGGDQENPTFYSAVSKLIGIPSEDWEKDWAPALAPYEAALETWLQQYAADPSITPSESGASSMTLRYLIPSDALKAAMKNLMANFLQDSALLELLNPLLTAEQQAVYLNPAIGYFYDAVIDALPLSGDLTMTRVLSTRGDLITSELVMPLPENAGGWASITLTLTGPQTALTLTGAAQSITLALDEADSSEAATSWKGFFRYLPQEGTPVSAAFTLAKSFVATTDEADGRAHETTAWTLTAQPDLSHLDAEDPARDSYADFDTISVTLSAHYSSRAQDNNPTTLELSLSAQLPSVTIESEAALRTTTPWVLTPLSTSGAEPLMGMSAERVAELLSQFALHAAQTMTTLTALPDPTVEPVADAEPTFVPPAQ